MGFNYNDLTLLRFIQKRHSIPLAKAALQFGKMKPQSGGQ